MQEKQDPLPAKKKQVSPPTLEHIGFPVFALYSYGDKFYVIGGGGKSKTGVMNAILIFDRKTEQVPWQLHHTLQIPAQYGAPMNFAYINKDYFVCGIDEYCHVIKREVAAGQQEQDNEHPPELLVLKEKFRTDFKVKKNEYDEPYQKVVIANPHDHLICTAGTDAVARLWDSRDIGNYFSPTEASAELKEHKSEINDVSFIESGKFLATTSSEFVCIWKIETGKKVTTELVTKLDTKLLSRSTEYSFRFGIFGRHSTKKCFFTVSLDKKRRAYIGRWNTKDWKLEQHTRVSAKPVTAFGLSQDGSAVAFGTSDGAVAAYNTHNLSKRWSISNAHGIAVTSVVFNEKYNQVISGSADQTCKVWSNRPSSTIIKDSLLLISLLVLIVAVLLGVWGYAPFHEAFQRIESSYKQLANIAVHVYGNQRV